MLHLHTTMRLQITKAVFDHGRQKRIGENKKTSLLTITAQKIKIHVFDSVINI